jgi:hypothetical protein
MGGGGDTAELHILKKKSLVVDYHLQDYMQSPRRVQASDIFTTVKT